MEFSLIKKIFLIPAFILISLTLFACVKKPKANINKELLNYKQLNQDELVNDFEYSGKELDELKSLSSDGKNKEVLYIPNRVTKLNPQAIISTKLKKLVVGPNTKYISSYSIVNNPQLEEIVFLNSFTSPGKISYNLVNLRKVSFINSRLTELSEALFIKSPKLTEFEIVNSNLEFINSQLIIKDNDLFKLAFITNSFNYQLDQRLTNILNLIGFDKKTEVKELVIPASMKTIGDNFITKAPELNKIIFNLDNLEYFSPLAIQDTNLLEISKVSQNNKGYDVINNTLVRDDMAILLSKNSNLANSLITKIGAYASNKNHSFDLSSFNNVVSSYTTAIGDFAFNANNISGEIDFANLTSLTEVGRYIFHAISDELLKITNALPSLGYSKEWNKR